MPQQSKPKKKNPTHSSNFEHIRDVIREKNIELDGADILTVGGFTQVPNVVWTDPRLTDGAVRVYGQLLSYAWHNGRVFPGQTRLAADVASNRWSVMKHLTLLQKTSYLTVKRRGQGKTNLYTLHLRATKRPRQRNR